jgi:hypothetical protein
MIISFKHKFIFFHCKKTAGGSIQYILSKLLGPDDIILGGFEEIDNFDNLNFNKRMIKEALFYPHIDAIKVLIRRLSFKGYVFTSNKKYYGKILGSLPQHSRAKDIKKIFPEIWDKFYKFCVVRNSYQQCYSEYLWVNRGRKNPDTFSKYLDDRLNVKTSRNFTNWEIYTINNKPVMDRIINYNKINEELGDLLKFLNIDSEFSLPIYKKNKLGLKNYSKLISNEEKEKIELLHKEEIDYFKFNFS